MTDIITKKERELARQAAYRSANRELLRAKARKYNAAHKERKREYNKVYNVVNKETKRQCDLSWRARNIDKARAASLESYYANKPQRKAYKLKKKYGITLEQYEEMYERTEGKCQICGSPRDILHVDHDHVTRIVRGLLCHKCNAAIGFLQDDPRDYTARGNVS